MTADKATQRYRLEWALLPGGWARDVVASVSDAGLLTEVRVEDGGADALPVGGYVIPGMPNAHSHAFQRALAGRTEFRGRSRDSFWTWRQAMYRLANRVDAPGLRIIATQLFIEMLKAGYTSVAEFHYLHRTGSADPAAGDTSSFDPRLWDAVLDAARDVGIGLTFLPTLYQYADFGAAPLRPEQRRFQLRTEEFLEAVGQRVAAERHSGHPGMRIGAAFHSLRAVPLDVLREASTQLRHLDAAMPIHIHVAEQILEVRGCVGATGTRPIELLLNSAVLNEHWCLVHCTHASPIELTRIAATGAAVCVSISTEANLGDGFFDAPRFWGAGGRLCIGSDSQSTVDPAEELRWLEYQQRLRRRRRVILADEGEPHAGTNLWRTAALAGARALGQPIGQIAVGSRADWLVLDPQHPTLAGATPESALDHVLFAGARAAIRDCCVAGRWVIKQGAHPREQLASAQFGDLMRRLADSAS
ncbi:MAG: formimidoylglutamate deiminase [Steroidobacteraceae bacterium]|nr:formimidoylglutamate deiminase [Steroidobacteraceae bacterium]